MKRIIKHLQRSPEFQVTHLKRRPNLLAVPSRLRSSGALQVREPLGTSLCHTHFSPLLCVQPGRERATPHSSGRPAGV